MAYDYKAKAKILYNGLLDYPDKKNLAAYLLIDGLMIPDVKPRIIWEDYALSLDLIACTIAHLFYGVDMSAERSPLGFNSEEIERILEFMEKPL